ncbi:uncharacterized protein LOC116118789 [Pistacia vera]|uniref:uncharacterized protein LOC116118789 n=1 Tax=Pistacia vera TaxID=55513 RepID=UPI001263B81C|nr:uncharacterized protein LOC116118789 [Pistacia vera]
MVDLSQLTPNPNNSGKKLTADSVNLTNTAPMSSSTLPTISPKLTRNNYRLWKSQILFAVGSHDLEEHLTGLVSCPSPFIKVQAESSDGATEKKPNPAHNHWKKVDKVLVYTASCISCAEKQSGSL